MSENLEAEQRAVGQSAASRGFQRWTRDTARDALIATNAAFAANASHGLGSWRIPDELRKGLLRLLGTNGEYTALASDGIMREAIAQYLVGQLLERHHAFPEMHFYMGTFIDDDARTKDLRCTLRFQKLMKKVHSLLAYAGTPDWFGVKEIQPYVNWQANTGRDLAPHVHVIIMTDGPMTRKQRRRLTKSRRFKSLTGAPKVKISERIRVDGELAHMICYLLKQPERGANLLPPRLRVQTGAGGPREVRQGYHQYDASIRSDLAIRLTEALSQLRMSQLLISGGEGKAMMAETRKMMRQIQTRAVSMTAIAADWAEARGVAGKDQYTPIMIEP